MAKGKFPRLRKLFGRLFTRRRPYERTLARPKPAARFGKGFFRVPPESVVYKALLRRATKGRSRKWLQGQLAEIKPKLPWELWDILENPRYRPGINRPLTGFAGYELRQGGYCTIRPMSKFKGPVKDERIDERNRVFIRLVEIGAPRITLYIDGRHLRTAQQLWFWAEGVFSSEEANLKILDAHGIKRKKL